MPHPQASFDFATRDRYRLDNYDSGSLGAAELLQRLRALPDEPGFTGLWLYGAGSLGKTHLLHGSARQARLAGRTVAYLPLARVQADDVLDGLDSLDLVALDDLPAWLRAGDRESALMALYQGLFAARGRLLISASVPALQLAIELPDLRSRLRSLAAYALPLPDDAARGRILQASAASRGLTLGQDVVDFWLARGARDLQRLLEDLELLIDYALGAQRGLTIPTLKQVLQL